MRQMTNMGELNELNCINQVGMRGKSRLRSRRGVWKKRAESGQEAGRVGREREREKERVRGVENLLWAEIDAK